MEQTHHTAHKPAKNLDRLKAAITDNVYVGVVNIVLTIMLIQFPINQVLITLVSLLVYLSYSVYFTVNRGQTFGKEAFGMTVVQYKTEKHITYTQSLLREFMKTGLALTPYIGFFYYLVNVIIIVVSKEKRGIHDIVAKTQVVTTQKHWSANKQFVYIMIPLIIFALLVIQLYKIPAFLKLSGAGI